MYVPHLLRCSALFVAAVAATACDRPPPPMTCAPWVAPVYAAQRPSPFDSLVLRTDTTLRAKLCYSRPLARGRVIFGGLVPYDTLWRTGANEATILHLAQPTEIAGLEVEEGDYSIYTLPTPSEWSVVVNAAAGQWGLTRDEVGADGILYYNAYTEDVRRQEVGRAPIQTEVIPFAEQLTARFESSGPDEHRLLFDWETTRIIIPLRFRPES